MHCQRECRSASVPKVEPIVQKRFFHARIIFVEINDICSPLMNFEGFITEVHQDT